MSKALSQSAKNVKRRAAYKKKQRVFLGVDSPPQITRANLPRRKSGIISAEDRQRIKNAAPRTKRKPVAKKPAAKKAKPKPKPVKKAAPKKAVAKPKAKKTVGKLKGSKKSVVVKGRIVTEAMINRMDKKQLNKAIFFAWPLLREEILFINTKKELKIMLLTGKTSEGDDGSEFAKKRFPTDELMT
jgi:predicted RND superfamily exporter protein